MRVDGIDHEVRLRIILFRVPIPKPPCTNGFHHDCCTWNLILDIALQNPENEMEPESCSDLFVLIETDSLNKILTDKNHWLRWTVTFRALFGNLCSDIDS